MYSQFVCLLTYKALSLLSSNRFEMKAFTVQINNKLKHENSYFLRNTLRNIL